ncbi:MAG: phosphoribosyltransferase family protein [Sulfurimonadaceae bacterium]|nr:phosphoribosyltransferase family protein [Sulfurimonadaceae bacterium]
MVYYSYDEFKEDTNNLIAAVRGYNPDAVVAVARGGMMLGQLMGYGLDLRNVQSIHVEAYDGEQQREKVDIFGQCDFDGVQRVLIVDDIVDSGMTLQTLLERLKAEHPAVTFKSASIFYKPTATVQPDFTVKEATEWINFFWEADFVEQ